MKPKNSKSGFLLAAGLALGALFVSVPEARGQDSCVAFATSLHAYSPVDAWIGEAWWAFGPAAPVYARELTTGTGYEKSDGDVWIGTEETTVDFGNGDTFQLVTRWVSHHAASTTGVAEVTEIGTITKGTGKFSNVSGVFFSPGTFGPGMSGDQTTWLWLGSRQGTICGLSAATTANTGDKLASPMQMRTARRR